MMMMIPGLAQTHTHTHLPGGCNLSQTPDSFFSHWDDACDVAGMFFLYWGFQASLYMSGEGVVSGLSRYIKISKKVSKIYSRTVNYLPVASRKKSRNSSGDEYQ